MEHDISENELDIADRVNDKEFSHPLYIELYTFIYI